jgi:glyoxylase-like metal-dependent hydrolase (beta-lactamase superfamily II)
MRLFDRGDMQVSTLIEREGPQRKTAELLPGANIEIARRHFREMEPFLYLPASDRIYNTYQSFVLRIPGRTILIDTCVGENKARPPQFASYPKKPWLDAFAAEGLTFADIDLVICTHLHVDHVGWNTTLVDGRWQPTFPKAKYVFGRVECEYWERQVDLGYDLPGRIWTDSCLPLIRSGQAELVEMDADLGGGVRLRPAPGHSPGMFCVEFATAGGTRLMFIADVMHHPIQCRELDWSTCFCADPAQAAATRRQLFAEIADQDVIVFPEHVPFPTAGRIESDGRRYRYRFVSPWWDNRGSTPVGSISQTDR